MPRAEMEPRPSAGLDDLRMREIAATLAGAGPSDPDWRQRALCAQTDPDAFYPEKGGSTRAAKKVCDVCPVRVECLAYALEHDSQHGVWGGLDDRERRRLKKLT